MLENLTLPGDEFLRRKETTLQHMKEAQLDALVAFSSYQEREGHVCYLCNHHISFPDGMSHIGLGHAAYVLYADGAGFLLAPLGYQPEKVVQVDAARIGANLVSELTKILKERGVDDRQIGLAGLDVIPAEYHMRLTRELSSAQFTDANAVLEDQRLIKSPAEVEMLRAAGRVAGIGLQAGMAAVKAGVTQHDVEMAVRKAAMQAGADFIPRVRVSSGKKVKTLTWPMTTNKTLEAGDMVFIDLIGWVNNYGFDNSRLTVVGKPSADQKIYLEHMIEATDWMIGAMTPNKEMEFVYTESRGRLIVPMAHGIGLEICENPWVNVSQRFTLKPGMTLCVEPILMSNEFGGMAVEDTVLISRDGVEMLTDIPRVYW
jgi:Xaa-Pro dipeptidase